MAYSFKHKTADPQGLDYIIASILLFSGLWLVYGYAIAILVLGATNYMVTIFAILRRK